MVTSTCTVVKGGPEQAAAASAQLLILAGLATKIGWAPVHNWLPDAHSEAPAPISALLSAALLPTVALVAWRVKATLDAVRESFRMHEIDPSLEAFDQEFEAAEAAV